MALIDAPRSPDLASGESADDRLLMGLVRECVRAGIGRRALLLRLSALPPALRRPQHLRLARAAIEPLARADRARVFTLPADDLAVVWRGDAPGALTSAIAALARLFEDEETPAAIAPWQVFVLPDDADRLLASIRPAVPVPPPPSSRPPPGRLDLQALGALETGLASVDVARFARRRRVCVQLADGSFRLRWEQRFLSIVELADALAPERAVQADPWLFRRLTRTLDQRMLALLAAPHEMRDAGPFSLALNVSSILSPGFLRFDAALPANLRGQIILELLPADVLGDLAAFMFARDFARERGYRLLLRDKNADLLAVFPLARIGVDLLQLRWSESLARVGGDLALLDPAHSVLTRTDSAQALSWGRAHGIGYFQGRVVEPP
jgi:hypothetical protein